MQETIMLMSQRDPKGTQTLVESGTVKYLGDNVKPYLVTIVEDGQDINE